jgi:hypothetical protein
VRRLALEPAFALRIVAVESRDIGSISAYAVYPSAPDGWIGMFSIEVKGLWMITMYRKRCPLSSGIGAPPLFRR